MNRKVGAEGFVLSYFSSFCLHCAVYTFVLSIFMVLAMKADEE